MIYDDVILLNSPPLIVVDAEKNHLLPQTIGILRQILMLNSFKFTVMIVTGLLQIQSEPNICSNVILSCVITFIVIIYCLCLHCFTHKYYLKENGIVKSFRNYRTIYLGLLSLLLLMILTVLNDIIRDWFFLVLILYPFLLFLTTTLAVASSILWIMISLSVHYHFMHQSIENNKCIFWIVALVVGFCLCELETRRIARSLRWSDLKRSDSWVRGGCCTNCWLHFCCAGCNAD